MDTAEMFWIAIFLGLTICVFAGHFVDRRRAQSVAEFERKRKARKEEVERAARKAL